MAKKSGYKIEKILTITNSKWLLFQWFHLLFYPKQGYSSIFWNNKIEKTMTFRKKILLRLINYTDLFKINHFLTRIIDLLGKGDNLLIFLRRK
jgi:hypothetical protein